MRDERDELEDHLKAVESQKARLERIFKGGSQGEDGCSLEQDVGFISRRLNYLEEQADERTKTIVVGQAPLKKQISKL